MTLRILLLVALVSTSAGCHEALDIGEACVDSADCMTDASCIAQPGATDTFLCMRDCDTTMTWICEDGLACLPTTSTDPIRPAELGSCSLGGGLPIGDSCIDRHLECTAGTVCVIFEENVRETCHRACSTDDASGCDAGEACVPFAVGTTNGYCQPSI